MKLLCAQLVLAAAVIATPTKRQTTWNPPSNLVTPLQQVWDHQTQTYPANFNNYGYDQLMASSANGTSRVCVRWEGNASISEAQRAAIDAAVKRGYKKWMDWLVGFDRFPFSNVPVTIVGYAVNNANQIQGNRGGLDVYTTRDSGGLPECDPRCGRFFHRNNDYGQCPGGAARHYDWSLWLTPGFGGGAGGDWGTRMGQEYFMNAVNSENIHIFLHELGHYFALDDFYDWTPSGVSSFIMRAGSATQITDFDGWMLRDWWRHLKSRYGLGREAEFADTEAEFLQADSEAVASEDSETPKELTWVSTDF